MATTTVRRRIPVPSFTSFHFRDYRLWWVVSGVVMLDRGMAQVALAWLVLELTDSGLWVGLTVFATGVPMFLFTFPAGILADRWDRRRLVLVTQVIAAVAAVLFAVAVASGVVTATGAVAFAFLSGTFLAVGQPVTRSLLPMLVSREHLLNGIALGSIAQNVSRLIGPGLAGVLIAAFGVAASFLASAVFLAIGVACAAMLRVPAVERQTRGSGATGLVASVREDVVEGTRFLIDRPPLLVIIGLMMATGLFMMGPHQTVAPIIVRDHLNAGAAGFGTTMTVMSLGGICTSLFLTSMGGLPNKGGFFAMALIGGSACFIGYAFSPAFAVALGFFFTWGAFGGFFATMSQTLLQSHTPGTVMGRVMAVNTVAQQGFMPLGALQAGTVAALAGPQAAALSSALICAALATAALLFHRDFRRLA